MVFVYIAEGFEEIEALTPVDVLRRGGLTVQTVSMGASLTVTGAHGVPIVCDLMFQDSENAQMEAMILPGGMPGASNLKKNEKLLERLRKESAKGTVVCAICAAPMVLASAGVLSGRRATIYPGMENELIDAIPCDERVCIDENVITSMGPATAMPFAFAILEALTDARTRKAVMEDMLIER